MNDVYFAFAQSMATENNINEDTAKLLTQWLVNEGVLDTAVLRDTYRHELPTATVLAFSKVA